MSGPRQTDGGQGSPVGQGSPRTQPWDWRIDLPPPLGPDREPVPDPAATAGVDAPDRDQTDPSDTDPTDATDPDAPDR